MPTCKVYSGVSAVLPRKLPPPPRSPPIRGPAAAEAGSSGPGVVRQHARAAAVAGADWRSNTALSRAPTWAKRAERRSDPRSAAGDRYDLAADMHQEAARAESPPSTISTAPDV